MTMKLKSLKTVCAYGVVGSIKVSPAVIQAEIAVRCDDKIACASRRHKPTKGV